MKSFAPLPFFAILLTLIPGCSDRVSDLYGESDGYSAKSSPGGLSIFRSMVESSDLETYSVRSLSPYSKERLSTLVWCPDYFPYHDKVTLDWIEDWLSTGNKTLVYIGRDYSPHADYWSEIARQQGNRIETRSQWITALDRAADAVTKLDAKRRQVREELVMPWCLWEIQGGPLRRVPKPQGEWSKGIDFQNSNIAVRSTATAQRTGDLEALIKRIESIPELWQLNSSGGKGTTSTEPYRSVMTEIDKRQLEIANSIQNRGSTNWSTVLSDENKSPLVGVVELDSVTQSKVIVVCNNSLFCNFSMLKPSHRQLASRMIDEFPLGGVGFLTGAHDPKIRANNTDDRQKGFEMLTTWPLNVVTIHAAFLGIAAILAAYPIFGRPKRLRRRSSADFGMHIEAIGSLMEKSGDSQYARKQISDYFRTVKKDSTSPWASTDPNETGGQSPFRSDAC